MLIIGSHVGYTKEKQMLGCVEEALSYGSNTFMFYTGDMQSTRRSAIKKNLTEKAIDLMSQNGIELKNVIVHAPFIINLCNEEKFDFSVSFLTEEIKRVNEYGVSYMVLHPGSHVGLGVDRGIENIIKGINLALENVPNNNVTVLLETMAGKGTEVGSSLEEIKQIIDGINDKAHIGVCLDTCHLNDAGYDMSLFDSYLDDFDIEIGISKIGCVHINDSKNPKSSHKDRHENIGLGTIGFDNLLGVIYNSRLENIPKILETPYVDKIYAPYKYEIQMIRTKKFDSELLDKVKEQ